MRIYCQRYCQCDYIIKKKNGKNIDLWELFQNDFKEYIEDDFKFVNNNNIQRLYNFFRGQGVWKEKLRTIIAKSLFNAL